MSAPPAVLAQFLPGDDFAWFLQQRAEDLKRLFRELGLVAVEAQFSGAHIQLKGAEADELGRQQHPSPGGQGWFGHDPPMGSLAKRIGLGIYVVVAAAAVFRRIEYRRRLLASFLAIYIGLVLTNLYYPHGPDAKSVITIPVFALVLLGP